MFLRKALRHRLWQSCVLAGISLLITTCAAFGPWFARAVEQTVATNALVERRFDTAWSFMARLQPRGETRRSVDPEKLDELLPAHLAGKFEPFVHGMRSEVRWETKSFPFSVEGAIAWREDACRHITLVEGRCPQNRNEIAVSTADQDTYEIRTGAVLDAVPTQFLGGGRLKVVGLYKADFDDPYWLGAPPIGRSLYIPERVAKADFLITPRSTFTEGVWGHTSLAETAPLPERNRLDDLPGLVRATDVASEAAVGDEYGAELTTRLPAVVDEISAERDQATTIIPLVLAQVALFGLAVLALAAAAMVDQRRSEIAVSRIRGRTPGRAGRLVAVELAGPVLAGTLGGIVTAFVLVAVVTRTWLDGGAPLEVPWTALAAAGAAALAGLGTIALAVRSVVRQPISALLRTVAPRRRGRALGLVDIVVIVLAATALVAAVTGDGRGPLPILTPTLLSLAIGLAFAHLLVRIAARVGPRALRRGRLGLGLAALQAARRPALTRVVAVVAVAAALVGFAGQASSIAGRNRELRSGYETGAAAILQLETPAVRQLLAALSELDPQRRRLTPVVVTLPPAPNGLGTLLVEPDSFRRIAYGADRITDDSGFQALRAPLQPIEIRGSRLDVTVTPKDIRTVRMPSIDGGPPVREPPPKVVVPVVTIVGADGGRYPVRMGEASLTKPTTLSAAIDCRKPCRLLRLGVARDLGDVAGIEGGFAFTHLGTDLQPDVPLGKATGWSPLPSSHLNEESISPAGSLALHLTSFGSELSIQHRSAPAPMAAVIARDTILSDGPAVPGVDGVSIPIQPAGPTLDALPRYQRNIAVADLETALRYGGTVDSGTSTAQLWLNEDGRDHIPEIQAALTKAGLTAKQIDVQTEHEARYARSASALALRLTPVVGLTGWLLAITVLMLMVVMSWRSRAHDYASLRITGVPDTATIRAARWEQAGPITFAALLGSACGVIGAQLALPLIPLFPSEKPEIPQMLGVDWVVALALWLISTVILLVTGLVLGRGVHRRATYARIREDLL